MTKSNERIDGIYKPRKPKETAFYNCVENHFEELEAIWDDLYASGFGRVGAQNGGERSWAGSL